MAALVCDMCGGSLCVEESGQFAVCESCGLKHSRERMQRKIIEVKGSVQIDGVVKTQKADFEIRAGELIAYHGSATEIYIPDEVKIIGKDVFKNCSAITYIHIPDEVTAIGSLAFSGCSSLQSIELPAELKSIGENAFSYCHALKAIALPTKLTSIGGRTFYDCRSLESIKLPLGVTAINEYTFSYCSRLSHIDIPNSVSSIGNYAFAGCSSLQSIKIPDGVSSLGDSVFRGCVSLRSLTIPASVKTMSGRRGSIIEGCKSLGELNFLPKLPDALCSFLFDILKMLDAADSEEKKVQYEKMIYDQITRHPEVYMDEILFNCQVSVQHDDDGTSVDRSWTIRSWTTPEMNAIVSNGKRTAKLFDKFHFMREILEFAGILKKNRDSQGNTYWTCVTWSWDSKKWIGRSIRWGIRVSFAAHDVMQCTYVSNAPFEHIDPDKMFLMRLKVPFPNIEILTAWRENFDNKLAICGQKRSFWSGQLPCSEACQNSNPLCPKRIFTEAEENSHE